MAGVHRVFLVTFIDIYYGKNAFLEIMVEQPPKNYISLSSFLRRQLLKHFFSCPRDGYHEGCEGSLTTSGGIVGCTQVTTGPPIGPFFGGYLWVSDLQQSLENMINTVRVHC